MYLPISTELHLTKNEKIIYDFLMSKKENILFYTEIDVSRLTGVSQPTVSRFWKKIGYNNFKEFKDMFKEDQLVSTTSAKFKSTLNSSKFYYKNYVSRAITLLEDSANKISEEDFATAVNWFTAANKIYTHAIGPAESLCHLLHFRLNRFGLDIHDLPSNGHSIYENLIHIKEGDLMVLFLFSYYYPETHVLLDYAKENNIKVILISDILIKPTEQQSLLTIYVSRGELLEFHSLVGPLFLIESLIVAIGSLKEDETLENLSKLETLREKYDSYLPRNIK